MIGCLDNVAARLATDAGCWLFGVPWIEGGIAAYQGSVTVFVPPDGPCYRCTLSAADHARERERYSCDQRRVRAALVQQIPAIQTVSSVIAATQVQETLHLLQGRRAPRTIFYDGLTNTMSQGTLGRLANHAWHHPTLVGRSVHEVPGLGQATPLAEALALLGATLGSDDVTIRLDHAFVAAAACATCRYTTPVLRPLHRIWADEYPACPRCGSVAPGPAAHEADLAVRMITHREVGPAGPAAFQTLTLGQLGIPPLHVIQARAGGVTHNVELTGDLAAVLGAWN